MHRFLVSPLDKSEGINYLRNMEEIPMKTQYVFQAFDGRLYGDERFDSPQSIGKINAMLRRDMSLGRWVKASSLTFDEMKERGNEYTARCLVRDGISSHQINNSCRATRILRLDQALLAAGKQGSHEDLL
jgi:hypothetical protein